MLTASPVLQGTLPTQATQPAAHPTFRLLNPQTPLAQPAAGPQALTEIDPQQMQAAYGVNLISFGAVQGTGQGQTIALIDAYNDPTILNDAQTFSTHFGLPAFNGVGEPTLQVLNQNGGTNLSGVPNVRRAIGTSRSPWTSNGCISYAPQANIILDPKPIRIVFRISLAAEQSAAKATGVVAVSNSWGTREFSGEQADDSDFICPAVIRVSHFSPARATADRRPRSRPFTRCGRSRRDFARPRCKRQLPRRSRLGQSVRRRRRRRRNQPVRNTTELSGGQGRQHQLDQSHRSRRVARRPIRPTGVPVLDSYDGGWLEVGGTSLASPMMAGLIAIADQGRRRQWIGKSRRCEPNAPGALQSGGFRLPRHFHRCHQRHTGRHRISRSPRLRPGHRDRQPHRE